jgi:hypothetical protein
MRVPGRPSTVITRSLYVVVLFSAWAGVVRAQDAAPPAHIAFAEGSASLDREGQSQPVTGGVPFLVGDRLRTSGGRVEVLFPDGSALDIDEYSSVELLSPTLLRVTDGRVMLIVAGAGDPAGAVRYQVDTPVASASTDGPGEYRVALLSGPAGLEAELAVLRGLASLRTERGSTPVRAGERSLARDLEAPSFPHAFNSARFDAFDRWSALRRDARLGTAQSAQYLPRELQMYGGTFDRYGAWQHEPQYGYVWYPAASAGWRPYYNGYWSANRPYGWTWIGLDVWGWPTHHYGRWGFSRSRWFWIPERRWAPSWVTWGAAPGYVSWCPLGFDNRPVFALSVNAVDPWLGWVAVPRTHFGAPGAYVHRYAVPRLPATAPVILQAAAPVLPRAIPRAAGAGAGPLAAGVAVPRASGQDIAVQRGSGYAAYGRPGSVPRTAPSAGGNQPLAARREPGVRVPGSGASGASPDFPAGQAGRAVNGFDQAVGRSPAAAIKVPLAEAPRAYQRSPSSIPRDPSGDATSRGVERSPARLANPWYGQQPTPWYGGAGRTAQPMAPADPAAASAADRQRRAYPRGPAGAPGVPQQMPIAPAPPGGAVPRWGGAPSAVQRAQPIYAPPAAAQPMRAAPMMRGPAGSAPVAVPRGSAPSSPAGAAPAAAPAQAAPRHAPASRRPS